MGTGSDVSEQTTALVTPTVGGPSITRDARPPRLDPGVGPGDMLGRYRIEERLGEGGMGVVLRAHDPKLQRDVALKIMRPAASGDSLGHATEIAQREARALAKLSHPNVVEIYDVGMFGGQLFLAMELLHGETLSRWLARRDRPWREVLEVLVAAGRGLAAAHDKGVVHRDFKPGNIVITEDGGVRVVDFGLAMTDSAQERGRAQHWFADTDTRTDPSRTGMIAGTPPYMAPEQLAGEVIDARSDQFAFCVAAFRSIYGVRPFDGESIEELLATMARRGGKPVDVRRRVPRAIHRAIVRGLSLSPDDRWPTMDALLEALRPRSSGRLGLGLTLGAFGALTVVATALRPDAPPCEAPDRARTLFDETTLQRIHEAMQRTELRYVEDTWVRFEPRFRTLGEGWTSTYLATCEARREEELAAAEADATVACLYRGLQGVETLVETIEQADPKTLPRVSETLRLIEDPARCATPDDEQRQDAALRSEDREQLVRASTLTQLGRYDDALAIADEVRARALERDDDALRWRTDLQRGMLLDFLGRYAEASELLTTLALDARSARDDQTAIRAATRAIRALSRQSKLEDAAHWVRFARSTLEGHEDASELWEQLELNEGIMLQIGAHREEALEVLERSETRCREASDGHGCEYIMLQRCVTLGEMGRPQDAKGCYEVAIDGYGEALGPWHPKLATPIDNLAIVLAQLDDFEAAERNHRRALEIREAALGPDHPEVGLSLNNLGLVELELDRLASAREHLQRAADNWEESLGPDHPHVAAALTNLALVLAFEGAEPDEVIAVHRRALSIREASLGPKHPEVGTSLANIGNQLREKGEWAESLEHLRRARALWVEEYGERSGRVASIDLDLASLANAQDDHDGEVEALERALASYTHDHGPEHSETMWAAHLLGSAELRRGDVPRAAPHVERARAFFVGHPEDVYRGTTTTFALARLRRAQGDADQALSLARTARSMAERLEATDSRRPELLADIDAFVSTR